MNKSRRWLMVFTVLVLFNSVPVMVAFSTPITGPVVVIFGHSEAECVVARVIREEFPKTRIVEFGSFETGFVLYRAVSDVIYVAHGDEQGIPFGTGVLSWDYMANIAMHVPSRSQYFAACYSAKASELASEHRSRSRFVGFDGMVDANIGALAIAAHMHSTRGSYEQALKLIYDLFDLVVAKVIYPDYYPFLPLALTWNYLSPPFSIGLAVVEGWVGGRATLGGGSYGDNIVALSGSYFMIDPTGAGAYLESWCDLPSAVAHWSMWLLGPSYYWQSSFVSYMVGNLNTNQRFMLGGPAVILTCVLIVLGGLSLYSLSIYITLIVPIINFFMSLFSPYIGLLNWLWSDPGIQSILPFLLNVLDLGSLAMALLTWDICRPR